MTAEAQRIAIAEVCGYTQEEPWLDGRDCWSHKDHPPHMGFDVIPDYLNDLNAMHEAEKILTNEQRKDYEFAICRAISMGRMNVPIPTLYDFDMIHSTAAQRCEAFLKTINKWTNDN